MKNFKINRNFIWSSILIVALAVGIFYSWDVVWAVSVDIGGKNDRTYICYDKGTGNYKKVVTGSGNYTECTSKGYGYTVLKTIGSNYAYCVNWGLKYYADSEGAKYVEDTSWKIDSKDAIKAGYLINLIQSVNNKEYSANKAYERAGAALNSYFAKHVGDAGAYNFSSNSEISSYLKEADTYYSSVISSKKIPKPTISDGGKVLSYNATSGKYFSNKITIDNLKTTYGGSNDTVTYTLSAKVGNNSVSICSNSKGTKCETGEITITDVTSYSFYVYVDKDKVKAGDTVNINIKGSNKSTYYSSVLYEDTTHNDAQKLIVIDKYEVSRSRSNSSTLTVPDLENHNITVYKVDENGNKISNSSLELYRDSVSSGNLIARNDGKDYMTYSTGDVTADKDDFFKHDYYLVETSAPSGFVFTNGSKLIKASDLSSSSDTVLCYKDGIDTQVNPEFCNFDNYYYMCMSNTREFVEPDENGNCEQNITVEPNIAEGDASVDGINDNGTLGSVIYTKVCYSKSAEDEVGGEYCSEKSLYTLVQHSDGNIVVFHPNSRNVINISKTDITGDKEILGASLKICTKFDYEANKDNCTAAKTIDDLEMSWISGETSHSIYGIPNGDYYIVETIPPKGYLVATTATAFSIDGQGKVVTGDMEITNEEFVNGNKAIVIKNQLTEIFISKRDITNKEELPGATISICETYQDDDGNYKMKIDQYTGDCIETILANGTIATWKSTNEIKKIQGLKVGTYYLVERIAPTDYSTAESVLFTLNGDGTLSGPDGTIIEDGNKLVMYDEPLEEKKTGSLTTYIVISILVGVAALGTGCIIYLKKTGKR